MNDQQIENEIQTKRLTAPRVTPQDIEANIASAFFFTGKEAVIGSGGMLSADQCANVQNLGGMTAAPAPSVPEEWREVMTELADDLAIEIDQSYPPERRAYPSEQRRYEREMEPVYRARALLQSSQAVPAVPEEWLAFAEFAARYKAGFHSKMRSGECPCWQCEVMRKARALLQSEVRHD